MNSSVKLSQEYFMAVFLQFLRSIFRHFNAFAFKLPPKNPSTPFVIIFFGPWTLYAATGTPHAKASMIASPNVSVLEGNTNTSDIDSRSATSVAFLRPTNTALPLNSFSKSFKFFFQIFSLRAVADHKF